MISQWSIWLEVLKVTKGLIVGKVFIVNKMFNLPNYTDSISSKLPKVPSIFLETVDRMSFYIYCLAP